jgi:hypothetical protein
MKRVPLRYSGLLILGVLMASLISVGQAANPSPVQELRIQKVDDLTYFHVRMEIPKDILPDTDRINRGFFDASPSLTPRLIGGEGKVRLVCLRVGGNQRTLLNPPPPIFPDPEIKEKDGRPKADPKDVRRPRAPVPVEGLEFVGRTEAKGEVKMKLLYAVQGQRLPIINRFARTTPPPVWKEMEVVLDFGKARVVAVPEEAAERKGKHDPKLGERRPPVRNDLEGLWAVAQGDQFVDLDNEVRDFGFYSFAAAATGRKYGIQNPMVGSSRPGWGFNDRWERDDSLINRELYESTTGSAAITESLQLRRMNPVAPRGEAKRTIPIAKIQGIDVAEHPWEKMMGDKKPAPEPFARFVPHDNYYIHFKSIARFLEFSQLLDQWGANLTRTYQATTRDHRLKDRYEQQLCLRSALLGQSGAGQLITGIAVTGNDAFVQEGTDIALLFQVAKTDTFLTAVEPFLVDARKKWGDRLKENTTDYNGVKIESFATPLREVSLHRAAIDDYVVYANSPVGLRRILDSYQGRSKRLSEMLDYKYMRTIFRYDDKDEDGFAFLSDAFIRNMVNPASKIKQRRRLEALVSLHMLTHGALYTAWETGKAPVSHPNILNVAGLKVEELPMPEGKAAIWDPENLVARSDVYNTIHFATPLIELPIDQVTQTEADEYFRFRQEYLGLWRQYFDPIGMRASLKEGKIQLDTYILPLIQNTSYNELRRITGQKTVRFDPASISDKTLFQYMIRLSSNVSDREAWFGGPGDGRGGLNPLLLFAWSMDPVGDWFLIRLDDSPVYEKLLRLSDRDEKGEEVDVEEVAKLIWSMPIAIGADIRNPLVVAGSLATLRLSVKSSLPGALTWEPLDKEYKGVSIVRIQATPSGRQMLGGVVPERNRGKDAFLPALYYAMVDGGFYLTLNEDMMHGLIDGAVAKREGKKLVEAATSLYVSPGAAVETRSVLRRLLERQTYEQARTSLPIWEALYRTRVVAEDATPEQAQEAAFRYLGYVPVSPDGALYKYDRKYDEVVNERHGSFRKPTLQKTTADNSPMNFLLDQLRSVRADLRFKEDGIHTVLTIDRARADK